MKPCSVPGCTEPLSLHQLETTEKLFGKPYCIKHEALANEDAKAASDKFLSVELKILKEHGWNIEKGIASKVIGKAEVSIDISKIDQRGKSVQVGGYAYEFGLNNELDAELKSLFSTILEATQSKSGNLPVKQEAGKSLAKKSDAELDAEIEKAKAKRFLEKRGSHYRVQGKERPDSHMIQNLANEVGICIELLEAYQDDNSAQVVVRGHLGNHYIDAVVHHDFKTEYQLKILEIARKNSHIIERWDGMEPVLKSDAMIETEDRKKVSAQYFIMHALLSFKKFALRDARTKAAAIAEAMLLNQDWMDIEETQSETAEAALVRENINTRKGVNA